MKFGVGKKKYKTDGSEANRMETPNNGNHALIDSCFIVCY